jgi:hypothetical protein
MPYSVIVYENSHYMDESESYTHGEFETADDALHAAKKLVDDELNSLFTPGMPPEDLYRQFVTFGVDPVIVPTLEEKFSAWDYAKERCLVICTPPPEDGPSIPTIADWFRISFDDTAIHLDVAPPGGNAWKARIEWARIVRVCFKAADFLESDDIYIFTDERAESHLVPTEGAGGLELWNEIIRRGLFDAELAIRAASSTGELFCDPAG